MPRYRKKPVVIDAELFVPYNIEKILDWVPDSYESKDIEGLPDGIIIETLEGDMKASYGDFIIKGVSGEFYPCKPDIFRKTYELVEDGKV